MQRNIFAAVALATLICSLAALAQPDTVWTRFIRYDPVNGGQWIIDVSEDGDGNVAIVLSDTTREFAISKFSSSGDSLWSRVYRDSPNRFSVWRATKLANHNIAVLGFDPPTQSKVWVVDPNGNTLFSRQIDCPVDYGTVIAPCPNGGAVVAADGEESLLVYKYDDEFNEIWAVTDPTDRGVRDIQVDEQGNILIAKVRGVTLLDEGGGLTWTNSFEINDSSWFSIYCCMAKNGEYWIAGERSTDNYPNAECWVVKFNGAGDSLFDRTFSFNYDIYGSWPQSVGLIEEDDLLLVSMIVGPIVGGYVTFRINESGELVWYDCCADSWYSEIECMTVLSDNGFVTAHGNAHDSVEIVRTEPDISSAASGRVLPLSFSLHPNHPNPFNATTEISFDLPRAAKVSLRVYDVLGREAAQLVNGTLNAGTHTVSFDAAGLASGVYFYRIETENFVATRKMVLLK